ncbi:MAG: TetR/AcrR family transcriptional regulator [Mariniphaga sp.]
MKEKTRYTILKVARYIFARRGAENTTMDDVAKASGFGRRTLYTYFSTREDLYNEVIMSEVEGIIQKLDRVATLKISPDKKIIRFVKTHMKTVETLVLRYKVLRMDFLSRSERIENFRLKIDAHEKKCLATIFQEGTNSGMFIVEDFENTAILTLTTLKGLERQFIIDDFGTQSRIQLEIWENILLRGIKATA